MPRLDAADLEPFLRDLLTAAEVPESTASAVAESLVAADLRGHGSHGSLRVPLYVDRIRDDGLEPGADPVVSDRTATTAHIDGNGTFGQVVGRQAVDLLTERAEGGVAAVGIRNAAHLGRVGEWAERVADDGYLFAAFVNTGGAAQTVTPPGSADRRLSTNPVAFGVPTFDATDFPVVLDMATSQVAHGKVRERTATGEDLPPDWTTDADGNPISDPNAFEAGAGAMLPLGGRTSGYKGFGLAVVAELFAGIVGDGPVAGQREPPFPENAAMFLAADPLAFTTRASLEDRLAALAAHLASAERREAVPLGPGASGDRALLPGEPEHRTAEERRTSGVPLADGVATSLGDLADELGVPAPAFD